MYVYFDDVTVRLRVSSDAVLPYERPKTETSDIIVVSLYKYNHGIYVIRREYAMVRRAAEQSFLIITFFAAITAWIRSHIVNPVGEWMSGTVIGTFEETTKVLKRVHLLTLRSLSL